MARSKGKLWRYKIQGLPFSTSRPSHGFVSVDAWMRRICFLWGLFHNPRYPVSILYIKIIRRNEKSSGCSYRKMLCSMNNLYTAGIFWHEFHHRNRGALWLHKGLQTWQRLLKRQMFLKLCKFGSSLDYTPASYSIDLPATLHCIMLVAHSRGCLSACMSVHLMCS